MTVIIAIINILATSVAIMIVFYHHIMIIAVMIITLTSTNVNMIAMFRIIFVCSITAITLITTYDKQLSIVWTDMERVFTVILSFSTLFSSNSPRHICATDAPDWPC